MKTKHKTKQPQFKQDAAYEWFESVMDDCEGFLLMFALFGAIPFTLFWLGCFEDSCRNINNIPMMVGYCLSFFIILELIYIWACKNQRHLDERDTIPFKAMAFLFTSIIMNIIAPMLYGIYILLKDYLINVLLYLGGCMAIIFGLWIFYRLNKQILIYIKESRKTR